ncbi:hypothetical protein [Nesterenkonia flava]|uniref:DUF7847 domain-containing protein n=1 Tax=Nesterenkonia flava TaxID=469799 RepID=A0ABU1FW50_9MICC|nr:hypothetical protein [Nesterenkonia flava]MDR5712462.1 hypothetical protein [Nesterenkonia flava]
MIYPVRRLAQDEVFGAAFAAIRHSPRAVLGVPFLAGLVNFLLFMVLLAIFPSQSLLRFMSDPVSMEDSEMLMAALGDLWVLLLSTVSTTLGTLLLTMAMALVSIPVLRSAYGLPTTLGQTLKLRAGQLGWLLLNVVLIAMLVSTVAGIALMLGLVIALVTFFIGLIVVIPALLLLLCWASAAVVFAPIVVVVERKNAFLALARSWQLNRGLWWRNMGMVALLYLMVFLFVMIASLPAGVLMGMGEGMGWLDPQASSWLTIVLVLAQLYDAVLMALSVGLVGAIITAMYLNCRIRQEALDVVLHTARLETPAGRRDAQNDDVASPAADTASLIPGSPEHVAAFHAGSARG